MLRETWGKIYQGNQTDNDEFTENSTSCPISLKRISSSLHVVCTATPMFFLRLPSLGCPNYHSMKLQSWAWQLVQDNGACSPYPKFNILPTCTMPSTRSVEKPVHNNSSPSETVEHNFVAHLPIEIALPGRSPLPPHLFSSTPSFSSTWRFIQPAGGPPY